MYLSGGPVDGLDPQRAFTFFITGKDDAVSLPNATEEEASSTQLCIEKVWTGVKVNREIHALYGKQKKNRLSEYYLPVS